ncbi:hypothetical protein ACI01nite_16860 [Acetobacter cibinongensis]|uniref:Uncharacterized protein n=1 Tax=Acetobacter cibinongensis TaxID=146475 RepID=A0A0D6N1D4_9PROT|nr:hypothetical protein Abci_003_099 [Acetobacter cibinongensis]GBQ13648.1 hypothetical protein AA0482_0669 [Acetobacter cibinongensis NRIC 0482]GEL59084.1 hypothetical protein ACI01nite_16860 [Acetobacter cibinongensis]
MNMVMPESVRMIVPVMCVIMIMVVIMTVVISVGARSSLSMVVRRIVRVAATVYRGRAVGMGVLWGCVGHKILPAGGLMCRCAVALKCCPA